MDRWIIHRIRRRTWYAIALASTILLGLASRRYPAPLAPFFGNHPSDVLWAMAVFFGWGMVHRHASTMHVSVLALVTSAIVEVLKLYRATWMVHLRSTTIGALVFGHVFSWQNLVAYTIGIILAAIIEMLVLARTRA